VDDAKIVNLFNQGMSMKNIAGVICAETQTDGKRLKAKEGMAIVERAVYED